MVPLADRRLLFFGGKGGVGKTTLASAAAVRMTRSGRSVLVVSTDPAHSLGHLWERDIGPGRIPLAEGLWGTELDPSGIAQEHVSQVAETVRGLMPEHLHRQVDRYFKLTVQAPGTHEAALLDALSRLVVDGLAEFDTIVFDTAPTGHTTRLLEMPRVMEMWTDGLLASRERSDRFSDAIRGLDGQRRAPDAVDVRNSRIRELLDERKSRFAEVQRRLTDPERTGFVVVTLPERLPVVESLELYRHLHQSGVDVPAVVVNRCAEPLAGLGDTDAPWRTQDQEKQIAALTAEIPAPILRLPQQPGPMTGHAAIARVAEQVESLFP